MQSGLAEEKQRKYVLGTFTETCSLPFLGTRGRRASDRMAQGVTPTTGYHAERTGDCIRRRKHGRLTACPGSILRLRN